MPAIPSFLFQLSPLFYSYYSVETLQDLYGLILPRISIKMVTGIWPEKGPGILPEIERYYTILGSQFKTGNSTQGCLLTVYWFWHTFFRSFHYPLSDTYKRNKALSPLWYLRLPFHLQLTWCQPVQHALDQILHSWCTKNTHYPPWEFWVHKKCKNSSLILAGPLSPMKYLGSTRQTKERAALTRQLHCSSKTFILL